MELKGIIPAILTPLTAEQKVNKEVTFALINHLIDQGVHGIFALGTNGEFHLFDPAEKLEIARTVIEAVNGRVPVMMGTGGNSTRESIELSGKMEELGADALSLITPYFIAPSQDELYNHFAAIAESTKLPVVLYNIPGRTGVNIEAETAARLARISNIIGVKDSSGSFENIEKYLKATEGMDFSVVAGTDSLILQTLQAGGSGAISATANMLPDTVVSIYNNWLAGDMDAAQKAQEALHPLRDSFKYGTLPSVLKKAVELYGIPVGPPKLPVSELSGDALKAVEGMVDSYKVKKSVKENVL